MFGRKRKKDDETVGLAGLGTDGVSPSLSSSPHVTVTPQTGPPSTAPSSDPEASPSTPESPFDAFAGLTPGSMSGNPAAMLGQILSGQGPVGELVAQIRADPEAFRQQMLAQAQAAGISTTMVTTGLGTPAFGTAAADAAAQPLQQQQQQPQHVDVIDELTKAADLHHQGVLTDAEFEAYKKKLLGG